VYSRPPGTDGIPNLTIESTKYNAYVGDVEQDLNTPRPIVAGGTGATTARDAMIALGGELANQVVTNYDSFPFVSGSFISDNAATASPLDGYYFSGIATAYNNSFTVLHAYEINTGEEFVRVKTTAGWGPWTGPRLGGDVNIASTTPSTASNTGALTVNGGLGVGLDIFAGGNIHAGTGTVYLTPTQYLFHNGTAFSFSTTPVQITSAVDSTSPTTGALTIAGGLGVVDNVVVGGDIHGGDLFAVHPASATTGKLYLGNSNAKYLETTGSFYRFVADPVVVASTASAVSPSNAALIVAGGIGVGNDISTGGAIRCASTITLDNGGADSPELVLKSAGFPAFNIDNFNGTLRFFDTAVRMSISSSNGAVSIPGGITGDLHVTGNGYLQAVGTSDAYQVFADETAATKGYVGWFRSSNGVRLFNATAGDGIIIDPAAKIYLGKGIFGKAGTAGAYDVNAHNFYWTGSAAQAWIDITNLGNITITCDYRIKKDVAPLRSTWEVVKRLRPITYTQREYTPPGATQPLFVNDDTWRWGFVAHELQDTLLPSAASGWKDSPTDIQSPNLLAIVAALTRALQEAMERIEALEAARAR